MDDSDTDTEMGNEMLVDETICLVCGGSTFVGETISCETCLRWFHFNCVGVTHSDPCVQSEDVPYFCPSCDVQNRKAKKAKRQSQAKDQKAKSAAAALHTEAGHSQETAGAVGTKIKEISAVGNEQLDTSGAESKEAQLLNISGQRSVGSHSYVDFTKHDFIQENMDMQEMNLSDTSADSEEEELVIDTKTRQKMGGKKSDNSGVVTQMVPQVELPSCLMEQPTIMVGGKSEEEAWLDAVESGNLQKAASCDSELRSLREPSLMTVRQRALASGVSGEMEGAEELEMLDFGGKQSKEKEMTEEDKVEKMVKAQKRKEMETEKKEKMKQKTMDTLLKKKDSKATKQIKILKSTREDMPKISYVANASGFALSFPSGHSFPLAPSVSHPPPLPTLCTMCHNNKKYNSSKTGHPVCSLACYKENLARAEVLA